MIRYEIWGGSIWGDMRDVGTYVCGEIQNVVKYDMLIDMKRQYDTRYNEIRDFGRYLIWENTKYGVVRYVQI